MTPAEPPSAATVWLRIGTTLETSAMRRRGSLCAAAIAARSPAPPPPTTTTSAWTDCIYHPPCILRVRLHGATSSATPADASRTLYLPLSCEELTRRQRPSTLHTLARLSDLPPPASLRTRTSLQGSPFASKRFTTVISPRLRVFGFSQLTGWLSGASSSALRAVSRKIRRSSSSKFSAGVFFSRPTQFCAVATGQASTQAAASAAVTSLISTKLVLSGVP